MTAVSPDFIWFSRAEVDFRRISIPGPLGSHVAAGGINPVSVHEVRADPRVPRRTPDRRISVDSGSHGHKSAVVAGIEERRADNLLLVVQAGGGTTPFPGLSQCGQQHGGQDCDDCNYNQQFYQCKIPLHNITPDMRLVAIVQAGP